MAYTKTTWTDNVTDIDANNLNKIEQGIYDNSLVVDAVTNTLNPTDTETYKTAEITEGQITDVIGVSDILIKGDTEQDGTPTPSAPVDVNVVSGSNIVNTSNKNLFIPTLKADGTSIFVSNATVSLIKDEYTFIASGYDMYFGNVFSNGNTYNGTRGFLMTIPTNATNIYIKLTNTAFSKNYINFYDENKISLGYVSFGATGNIAVVENAKYCTLRIGAENSVSGTTYKTKVMVSTMNKAYIPHQGKELPLDLPVENLLNISNDINTTTSGITVSLINTDTIDFNGVASNTYISTGTVNLTKPLESGKTYYFKVFENNDSNLRFRIWGYDSNNELKFNVIDGNSLTLNTNIVKYRLILEGLTANNKYNVQAKFQVSEAPYINTYTPYGTEPIELCKIGNYQDYFYKSGSKWYLHKETVKDVVDENNMIAIINTGTSNWYYKITPKKIALTASQTNQICNYYPNREIFNGNTNQGILKISNGEEIRIRYGTEDTVANFKTWLASNNIILYCILATATDTEITDTTLISQLEAIYNAPLYEQTNITQTNNDLPMVLDITACKDNINGIKAFIRK